MQKTFQYRLRAVGKEVWIGRRTFIRENCVEIGDYSVIGADCWLAAGHIQIGRFVVLAPGACILGGDHRFDVVGTPSLRTGRDERKPVVIEDDVWIGRGALIMHGVRIGEGAIVAAGSLVTKDVAPYAIVAGPPASVLGQRFGTAEELTRHERMLSASRSSHRDYARS